MKIFGLKINIEKDRSVKADGQKHEVLCIDDKAETYTKRWGITDKRKDELEAVLHLQLHICKTDVEAIEKVSKVCVHPNEVAYITMAVIKENNSNPLSRLFRSMMSDYKD